MEHKQLSDMNQNCNIYWNCYTRRPTSCMIRDWHVCSQTFRHLSHSSTTIDKIYSSNASTRNNSTDIKTIFLVFCCIFFASLRLCLKRNTQPCCMHLEYKRITQTLLNDLSACILKGHLRHHCKSCNLLTERCSLALLIIILQFPISICIPQYALSTMHYISSVMLHL